jgi:hypothetical protein
VDRVRVDVGARLAQCEVACTEIRRVVLPRISALSRRSGRDNGLSEIMAG